MTAAAPRPVANRDCADSRWRIGIWLLVALCWFATMQVRPLLDPDEGRYAEIPREMALSGDWVTPRLNGLKYFEKPPLQYWATAAAYSTLGVEEWIARLWGTTLAFLCFPLIYAWTDVQYGRRAALAAVGVLATSPLYIVVGQLNLLDAGFTFWLTAALLAFSRGQTAPVASQSERRWMLVAWTALALAVLTKGIVVFVLGGLSLATYVLLGRDTGLSRRLHVGAGLPLFLAISSPWFIAVSIRNPEFPQFFFQHEHFARFLTTVHNRAEPWWYFVPVAVLAVAPWLSSLPGGVHQAWIAAGPIARFRPLKFLTIFAAVTFLFFSASGSKLAPYILPMLPALAVVVGVHAAGQPRFMIRAARVSAALMVIVAIGLAAYARHRSGFVPLALVGWSIAASGVALLGLLATHWPMQSRSAHLSTMAMAASAVLGWQCLMLAYTELPPMRSARELAADVMPFIGADTPLYSVGQYRQSLTPYLGRTMTLVAYRGELAFGLEQEPGSGIATLEEFLDIWRERSAGVAFCDPQVLASLRQQGMPGKVIAADHRTVAVSRQ